MARVLMVVVLLLSLAGCGWHHRHHEKAHGGGKHAGCQCPGPQGAAPAAPAK